MEIPVFGIEHTTGKADSSLSYTLSTIYNEPPRHTHTFYEFFIVTEGTALHLVNGAVQTIHKGDFFFIRPNDEHCYSFYDSENFQKLNLGFMPPLLQNIRRFFEQSEKLAALLKEEFPPCVHLEGAQLEQAISLMEEAGSLVKTENALRAKYHAQCILAIFFETWFFQYEQYEPVKKIPDWLSSLLAEMQKIDNLKAGYKRMCSLAPCSHNHLCRSLKQFYGLTPTEYINEQRLNYSVYLLTRTDMEILDICETCGFSNLSHFYHLFKEQFGKSPGKFRCAST